MSDRLIDKARRLIEMAKRRQRPGTGSSKEFLEKRTALLEWVDLEPVLGSISWAVVGGVSTRMYMPERATQNLDILISATDSEVVLSCLKNHGFTCAGPLKLIPGTTWKAPNGEVLVVMEGSEEWVSTALKAAKSNRDVAGLPILPLPYLVLMKLFSSRLQDISDVVQMLGHADDALLSQVRAVVARYRPLDVEDLESMIQLGKLELD